MVGIAPPFNLLSHTKSSFSEFVVVRNAGGRAEPAIRDICVLSTMTEITDLVVIHHSGMIFSLFLTSQYQTDCTPDCGMTHLTNDAIRSSMKSRGLGDEKLDTFEFGEILE
jgi:hypothetical protein